MLPCLLSCALAVAPWLPDSVEVDSTGLTPGEGIIEEMLNDTGGAELLDELTWRSEHPIDLNHATVPQLLAIPGVSEEDAGAIVAYREIAGRFLSTMQLQTMEGGSARLYKMLSPCVTLRRTKPLAGTLAVRTRVVHHRLAARTVTVDPPSTSTRVTVSPVEGLELGGTIQKDAGESMRDAFAGGYGVIRPPWGEWEFILGDFTLQAGLGLALWNGGLNGKSAMSTNPPGKPAATFLPHRTGQSNRFFRGLAATSAFLAAGGRWRISAFASRRTLAARTDEEGNATSILEPGETTTSQANSAIKPFTMNTAGGRVEWTGGERLFLGFPLLRTGFDRALRRDDPLRIAGNGFGVEGFDIRFSTPRATLFAEMTWNNAGARASIAGVRVNVFRALSLLLVYRSYDPRYDNLLAAGFGDKGSTRNERGPYAGMTYAPGPLCSLRGFVDLFRHPAPTPLVPFGVKGAEYLIDGEVQLGRTTTLRARFSRKVAETRVTALDPLGRTIALASVDRKSRLHWGMGFSPGGGWMFQTRLEWVQAASAGGPLSHGVGISHMVRGRVRSLRFVARAVMFSSTSYASCLSMIENDLPGVFGGQSLSGQGVRWYALASLDPFPWCSLAIKVSVTNREEEISHDTRPLEIPATADLRTGLQLDLHW